MHGFYSVTLDPYNTLTYRSGSFYWSHVQGSNSSLLDLMPPRRLNKMHDHDDWLKVAITRKVVVALY